MVTQSCRPDRGLFYIHNPGNSPKHHLVRAGSRDQQNKLYKINYRKIVLVNPIEGSTDFEIFQQIVIVIEKRNNIIIAFLLKCHPFFSVFQNNKLVQHQYSSLITLNLPKVPSGWAVAELLHYLFWQIYYHLHEKPIKCILAIDQMH